MQPPHFDETLTRVGVDFMAKKTGFFRFLAKSILARQDLSWNEKLLIYSFKITYRDMTERDENGFF